MNFQRVDGEAERLEGKYSAAVGAGPGDVVAGHAPEVIVHAFLADVESA